MIDHLMEEYGDSSVLSGLFVCLASLASHVAGRAYVRLEPVWYAKDEARLGPAVGLSANHV